MEPLVSFIFWVFLVFFILVLCFAAPYLLTSAMGIPDEELARFPVGELTSTWRRWFALTPVPVSNEPGPWRTRYAWLCFFEWRYVRLEDGGQGPSYLERRHTESEVFTRFYQKGVDEVMMK